MKKMRKFDKDLKAQGYGANLKMNPETYKLRREVIEIIYKLKGLVELPRIEVRINERPKGKDALAIAVLNQSVIYITEAMFGEFRPFLFEVVLHEIVHAVTGFGHDDKCPLMAPRIGKQPLSDEDAIRIFLTYFK